MPEMTPFNQAITRDLKIDKIGLLFTVFDKTDLVQFWKTIRFFMKMNIATVANQSIYQLIFVGFKNWYCFDFWIPAI
jgi:hypothetical protein